MSDAKLQRFLVYLWIVRTRVIQNLFFATVSGLSVSMLLCDMCTLPSGDEPVRFSESVAFVVLSLVSFILGIASLCCSSRPQFKLRFSVMSAIILAAYQIWIAVFFFRMNDVYVFTIPSVFPMVALILDMLALRYVVRELSMSAAWEIKSTMDMAKKHSYGNKTNKIG